MFHKEIFSGKRFYFSFLPMVPSQHLTKIAHIKEILKNTFSKILVVQYMQQIAQAALVLNSSFKASRNK